MINADVLMGAGIDYNSGLEHFLNDEDLYERVLRVYEKDDVVKRARAAFEIRDMEALKSAVHEAKGTSGNADIMAAYKIASEVMDFLRSGEVTEEQLISNFNQFESIYLGTQEAVRTALS